jgi:hypothetical protein
MTFKNGEPADRGSTDAIDADLIESVRADLAAIEQRVFWQAAPLSLDERLNRLRAAVDRILGPDSG